MISAVHQVIDVSVLSNRNAGRKWMFRSAKAIAAGLIQGAEYQRVDIFRCLQRDTFPGCVA